MKNQTFELVERTRKEKAGESEEEYSYKFQSKEYGKNAVITIKGKDTADALGYPTSIDDTIEIKAGKINQQSSLPEE